MYNPKQFLLYSLMILFASVFLAACRAVSPAPLDVVTTPGIILDITSTTCPSITVTAGDQITWINQDQKAHLIEIKSSQGEMVFSAENLQPGDTASFTITKTGSFVYVCSNDQKSTGTITVEP